MGRRLPDAPLRLKLLGSFGLVLLVLLALSAAAYRTTAANQVAADAVAHTLRVIGLADAALTALVDMETGYRGFLLTGREEFLEPYVLGRGRFGDLAATLRAETADNPPQVARWDDLVRRAATWQAEVVEPGIVRRREVDAGRLSLADAVAPVSSGEGKRAFDGMRGVVAEAVAVEQELFSRHTATAAAASAGLQRTLIVGTLGATGLGLLLTFLLARDVLGPVDRLAAAADRMARGDLSRRIDVSRRDELGRAATAFDRMADELQALIRRNQAILEAAAEGILGLDHAGRIAFANPAAAGMLGLTVDALIGRLPHDIVHQAGADTPAHRIEDCPILRGLAGGVAYQADDDGGINHEDHAGAVYRADDGAGVNQEDHAGVVHRADDDVFRRADGSEFAVEYVAAPILEGGRATGWVMTFRDVTERRTAARALEDRARDLARSNSDLEQFAYVASHDLQEPLRAIVSYIQLIERWYKGQLDERADRYIAHAVEGARRMQALINDLLAYSRVGRRGEAFVPTDVEAVVEQALAVLRIAVEESGACVTHDPLPTITADATQLGQIFQNLIGNAIKFHGEAAPRVHISAERRDGEWLFSVRDNGIGIGPEYRDRVFVIFQRLHARDEYPGTGIGLAVCKKVVERHGGQLWLDSEVGRGSTFCFTIPDTDVGTGGSGP